jgi:hypothetical protein
VLAARAFPDLAPLSAGEIALWLMVASVATNTFSHILIAAQGRRLAAVARALDALSRRALALPPPP